MSDDSGGGRSPGRLRMINRCLAHAQMPRLLLPLLHPPEPDHTPHIHFRPAPLRTAQRYQQQKPLDCTVVTAGGVSFAGTTGAAAGDTAVAMGSTGTMGAGT